MLPRFLAAIDPAAGRATLDADEAHHLAHVMRLGAGDEVAVFDGAGREFRARVDRAGHDGALLQLIEPVTPAPEPQVSLTLAQAVLKGDKMDDVVRDATMMGVVALQPVISEHTIGRRGPDARAHQRWTRVAIASVKQCRRAVVPAIEQTMTFEEAVARQDGVRLLLAEPATGAQGRDASSLGGQRPGSATLLVGPEGGWSRTEVDAAVRAGWTPITLGKRTLRADAVAIVAIGVLQYLWGDL